MKDNILSNELKEYEKNYQNIKKNPQQRVDIESGKLLYAKKKLIDSLKTAEVITDMLLSDSPCMISRFGGNEIENIGYGLTQKFPIINPFRLKKQRDRSWGLFHGAGVFPYNVNILPRFTEITLDACKEVDLLGVWFNKYEDFVIEHYMTDDLVLTTLGALSPISNPKQPWSESLRGKKVLVVSPFGKSIQAQYAIRTKIYEDRILPQMDLITYIPVNVVNGRKIKDYSNWCDALEKMGNDIEKINFDIAILGCGAYGMPLAARIKRSGRKAIHLGGDTQLLFGIIGNRWSDNESLHRYVNENWIHPLAEERPKGFENIEGGCYW